MAGGTSGSGEMISGINVTPLVDVVLVLLVVLMVSASYTVSKSLPMELPQAKTGESETNTLAISIDQRGALYLNARPLERAELQAAIEAERRALPEKKLSALIAADGRTSHRHVVGVIDELRKNGVSKFSINVAPEDLEP